MNAPAIVYIHGFNSSPQSTKARQLAALLAHDRPQVQCRVPALPHDPDAAMALLEDVVAGLGRPLLIGSSLGGFYAGCLAGRHGLRAVLINPVVSPGSRFAQYVGPQRNHYTGEQWALTAAHVAAISALEGQPPARPQDFLVLLQTGDETLDWRDAAAFYRDCSVIKLLGGNHGFEHFEDWLPVIYRFAGLTNP